MLKAIKRHIRLNSNWIPVSASPNPLFRYKYKYKDTHTKQTKNIRYIKPLVRFPFCAKIAMAMRQIENLQKKNAITTTINEEKTRKLKAEKQYCQCESIGWSLF